MPTTNQPDHLFFSQLAVENVRAFAQRQILCLADAHSHPAPWTLILGENGVGKTTLLQALARMRPVPGFKRSNKPVGSSDDAGVPDRAEPELSRHEDPEISKLVRLGTKQPTSIEASFTAAGFKSRRGRTFKIGIICEAKGDKLAKTEFAQAKYELHAEGPLVIGYGAGRRIGHSNIPVVMEGDFTASLFEEGVALFDAEEILEKLHYASLTPKNVRRAGPKIKAARQRLDALKEAVAALIPDLTAAEIDIRGPRVPGRSTQDSGVHVKTPSGPVPFSELSLGYQTGLVRSHLRTHFPNVQFIATTHSPITAQETLAAGGNIVVVRWEDDQSVILNNPIPKSEWRVDQLLTSDLFGFESARGPDAEAQMRERTYLIRKRSKTPAERQRLKELDDYVLSLPTSNSPAEQKFEDLMRKVAKLEGLESRRRT